MCALVLKGVWDYHVRVRDCSRVQDVLLRLVWSIGSDATRFRVAGPAFCSVCLALSLGVYLPSGAGADGF